MSFTEPIESYAGAVRETTIGAGDSAVTIGGAKSLPFYNFDAPAGNAPKIAMEVYDSAPQGWPAALESALGDVAGDPVAWAKRCVELGADAVCVQLASTDPNGADTSADDAAAIVKAVTEAVNVPVIVYGCGNADKDAEVLKKVAEACDGSNLLLGPATEDNYKAIVAAALGYGHGVIGETPIDVNMAKQLNILMTQLGLDASRIVMDPSTGAIGYGIEYAYTVMERLRLAALGQCDDMCSLPIIVNLGKEAWRAKEAKATDAEEPAWGDETKRGVLWEATSALTCAMGGADLIVMRHPDAVALVKQSFASLADQ